MEIIKIPISELTPDPHNAKDHPKEQIEQIKNSIEQFGNLDPIGVWGPSNMIVEGHGRYEALKALGYQEAECIRLDWLTEEERRAYALAHNKLTMNSDFIPEALEMNLDAIGEIDMSLFGFEMPNEDEPQTEIVEDEPPEEVETRCKLGDVWQLGEHRLICGDSTSKEQVKKLFDGEQPFCIVTDPPYCSGGFQEAGKKSGSIGTRDNIMIANDTLSTRGYTALIKSVLERAGAVGIVYMFTDWRMWVNLFDTMEASGYGVRNMIVWNKGTPGMGVGWRAQHELCLMGSRSAQKFNPHKAQGNVITCQRTGNINHPTEKPVELISKIIDVTDFANIIYDPFGGSGTTLIACEQLNRKCFMCELDPHYCDVIIQRWENMTGKAAELVR